jgi:hypothetical protein
MVVTALRSEATALLGELEGKGVILHPTLQGTIKCSPLGALTDKDKEALRRLKPVLLTLLSESLQPYQPSQPYHPATIPDIYRESDRHGPCYGPREDTVQPCQTVPTTEFERRELQKALRLGLVCRFSREFGWIDLHDPTTGEWTTIEFKDAEPWMKRECFKRKELWKSGDRHFYTRAEMERIWEREEAPMWEASAPLPGRKIGLVYEDEVEEG